MTAKELIAILEEMPQDANVNFSYKGNPTFHGTPTEIEAVAEVRMSGGRVVLKG